MNFETEFKKYEKDFKRYAFALCRNKEDADDLFQETAILMFKNINSYDTEKANGENGFKWWGFTIMKNTHISMYRKMVLEPQTIDDEKYNNDVLFNVQEEDITRKKEMNELLNNAMRSLNIVEEKILRMSIQGYSYNEMSNLFNLPLHKIKTTIFRAKKKLSHNRELIKSYC